MLRCGLSPWLYTKISIFRLPFVVASRTYQPEWNRLTAIV